MPRPTKLPLHTTGTIVYRACSPTGDLLYVGITDQLYQRMAAHSASSPWWHLADHLLLEECATRSAARVREAELIQRFAPPFNVQHQREQALAVGIVECETPTCEHPATEDSDLCAVHLLHLRGDRLTEYDRNRLLRAAESYR